MSRRRETKMEFNPLFAPRTRSLAHIDEPEPIMRHNPLYAPRPRPLPLLLPQPELKVQMHHNPLFAPSERPLPHLFQRKVQMQRNPIYEFYPTPCYNSKFYDAFDRMMVRRLKAAIPIQYKPALVDQALKKLATDIFFHPSRFPSCPMRPTDAKWRKCVSKLYDDEILLGSLLNDTELRDYVQSIMRQMSPAKRREWFRKISKEITENPDLEKQADIKRFKSLLEQASQCESKKRESKQQISPEERKLLELLAFYQQKRASTSNGPLQTPLLKNEHPATKAQLLDELAAYCESRETALHDEFDAMSFDELKQIRKLGKHCFTLPELFQTLKAQVEQNKPAKDPTTNLPWDKKIQDAILSEYQQDVDAKATIQRPIIPLDEKNVHLEIEPVQVPSSIGVTHPFWRLLLMIRSPAPGRILDLGMIPEYSNPRDVSDSSAVALSLVRQLWDERRLLAVHSPNDAIQCCTVHLKKPASYWLRPDGEVDGRLVSKMIEELKDKLS